jgi:tetratricopeptide (TPR) repeat protein
MRKIIFSTLVLSWALFLVPAFADEQPLTIQGGILPEARQHHEDGIQSYNQGNYEEAYKHFRNVLKIAPSAESYYNGALSLHKLGFPKEAASHFYFAKKYANGNANILRSKLVKKYVLPVQSKPKRRESVRQAPYRSEGS